MTSFFANMKHKMPPISADKKMETEPFLLAAAEVVPFIEMLGTMFKPVKNDISGNINALEAIYQKNPEKYVTLHDMLEDEKANGNPTAHKSAGLSLLWLKRALSYLSTLIRNVAQDETKKESITDFVQSAYVETLQRYHGWIANQVFRAVAHAAPYRSSIMSQCGVPEVSEDQVVKDMLVYADGVALNVAAVDELMRALDLDTEIKG